MKKLERNQKMKISDFNNSVNRILAGGESVVGGQHAGSIPVIKKISLPDIASYDNAKSWAEYVDRGNEICRLIKTEVFKNYNDINNEFSGIDKYFIIPSCTGILKLSQLPASFYVPVIECFANLDCMYRIGTFRSNPMNNIHTYYFPQLEAFANEQESVDMLLFGYKSYPSAVNVDWFNIFRGVKKNEQ